MQLTFRKSDAKVIFFPSDALVPYSKNVRRRNHVLKGNIYIKCLIKSICARNGDYHIEMDINFVDKSA